MRITNEAQFKERVKYTLDRWIEGLKLLTTPFHVDYEDDSDIVEFTEEELDNGEGYILEDCLGFYNGLSPALHISSTHFGLFAKSIGSPVHRYYFRYEDKDCYEMVFKYRDVEFYCLMDYTELSECLHMVDVVNHDSERRRV